MNDIPDPGAANERFREEAARWSFRFRCEDCDHFAPAVRRCSMGFVTAWLTTPELRMVTDDGRVVFCKYFECW